MDVIIKWTFCDFVKNCPSDWEKVGKAQAAMIEACNEMGFGDIDVEVRNEE